MRLNTRAVRAHTVASIPNPLMMILNAVPDGFTRLEVRIEEVRTSESKKGKVRTAILVARANGGSHARLHQCYLAAIKLMWRHYRLGDSPIVDTPQEPLEFLRYSAVFNHMKALQITFLSKHIEFVHTQAELLYLKHKDTRWFDHYAADGERIR